MSDADTKLPFILWDFEGTLAVRKGRYAQALLDAARASDPAFAVTAEGLRPFLSQAFPWNGESLSHAHGRDAGAWWAPILEASARALTACGMAQQEAAAAAREARRIYLDIAGWRLYPGVIETLESLSARGWRHAILSNFAPELEEIVSALGLADHIDQVFASGRTGFEKPSRASFEAAFAGLLPGQVFWMIGDNAVADIAGGQAAGLSTILIGAGTDVAGLRVDALPEIAGLIGEPWARG